MATLQFWCVGFSFQWHLLWPNTGPRTHGLPGVTVQGLSSCSSRALEHRLSSCGARPWLLCGMWDLSRPGIEPMSPAVAGRFFTTEPPGKPYISPVQFSHSLASDSLLPCELQHSRPPCPSTPGLHSDSHPSSW